MAARLPRYIFADVDDTVTVAGSLSCEVLAAVERAASAGIEVIFNTGRSAGYGATLLAYLGSLSAVIVENGGAFFDRRSAGPIAVPHGDTREVFIDYVTAPTDELRSRLARLAARIATRAGLVFHETADNPFRLTDYTVLRELPKNLDGVQTAALLRKLADYVREESDGAASLLASSIHIHFMLDGQGVQRSKADGAAALLARRGIVDVPGELRNFAIAVGDSANDASFFAPGRFAFSVGVANIEHYLHELGEARPLHITHADEGLGFVEFVDDLLGERLPWPAAPQASTPSADTLA